MKIYIYRIFCLVNKKSYIGITNNPKRRLVEHKAEKYPIGNAIRKYGIENFELITLDVVNTYKEAYLLEPLYIKEIGTLKPQGYNLDLGGKGGCKITEETRAKLRAAKLGKKQSPEHIAKVRISRAGYRHSKETKAKIGAAHKGKKRKPFTKETKKKMSIAKHGNKNAKRKINF